MVFNNYAKYYNLLYKDKDYKSEAEYVLQLIKQFHSGARSLLDVGCGTGIHASYFAKNELKVTGIDQSEEMIRVARSKEYQDCIFKYGKAEIFNLDQVFDVVTSLFHVISYQTTNIQLEQVLKNVVQHLHPGGLFIFDFWYTPAVLNLKPAVKIKRLEDQSIEAIRISEPNNHFNENIVDVNFDVYIKDKTSKVTENIREIHKMRYFSLPEMNYFLEKSGLEPILYEEWMSKEVPSENTWGVCCVSKKSKNES